MNAIGPEHKMRPRGVALKVRTRRRGRRLTVRQAAAR